MLRGKDFSRTRSGLAVTEVNAEKVGLKLDLFHAVTQGQATNILHAAVERGSCAHPLSFGIRRSTGRDEALTDHPDDWATIWRRSTKIRLSQREQDRLPRAARRKSNWETFQLLTTSVGTVKFHLTNASLKLDSNCCALTIARSLWFGLIDAS
jgi:DNA-binding CsgD family transcriptional regulator